MLSLMARQLHEYGDSLRDFVQGYTGAHERAVLRAPEVYEFFAHLFADDRVHRDARQLVNGVLAYFVAPGDVLPEEDLGPYGLLDDLFVATHAFRLLRRELPDEVILAAWTGDGDLDDVFNLVHTESRAAVGKKSRDALRMAGLG
jgi:uncharacterized membrane protein YkvA (DUF1232 family)